jgi:ubiquinone/menaquinone biosynthesis C-methylase UbiE
MKNDEHKPTGAGKSSFKLIDTAKFFSELDLQNGVTFLDVACGWGSYSLAASDIVGKEGQVYAVDLWEEGILNLRKEAVSKGSQNLEAFVSDCVDVCLMATALHDFVGDQVDRGAMKEIVRVMKPEGILVIVEYKKKDGPPGPPKPVRLSPQEVDTLVSAYGFKQKHYTEIGAHHYLQIFGRKDEILLSF